MTVVVTGSTGFLGGAVVRELLRAGYDCLGIDRRPGDTTAVVADLLAGDPAVATALRAADGVIHLAGRAGVRDPAPDIALARQRDNVQTTARVLDLVPTDRPLVVTSSSSVYGGAHGRPCRETDPVHPRGGYARSKVAVERLCAARGGAITVARPFTVVGEGQRADMALARWARQVRSGDPLTVLGSPERTRDLTDVRTTAAVLVRLLELGRRTTVNIASGRPRSLGDLIGALGRALELEPAIMVRPATGEEPADTHADVRLLQLLVGPLPPLDLDDVVARAVGAPALVGRR